jgi:hypothetical protein
MKVRHQACGAGAVRTTLSMTREGISNGGARSLKDEALLRF